MTYVEEPTVDGLFNYRCKPLDNICRLSGFELPRKFTPMLLHPSLLHMLLKALAENL
jgi:hypothetical protein